MPLSMTTLALAVIAGNLPLLFLPQLPTADALCCLLVGGWLLLLTGRCTEWYLAVGLLMLAWSDHHARLLLVQTTAWSQGNQTLVARLVTLNLSADKTPARISHINGQRVFPPVAVVCRATMAAAGGASAGAWAHESRWIR